MKGLFLFAIIASAFAHEFDDFDEYFETEDDYLVEIDEKIDWCPICHEIAQFAEDFAIGHASEALRKLIKEQVCEKKKSQTMRDLCEAATDKLIDHAIDLVRKYVNPETICTKLKLC